MKSASNNLSAHIEQPVTTLSTCWKITRHDGTVMCFTDASKDIVYDGLTYSAASGFTPSAISTAAGLSVDNLDIEGAVDHEAITADDIRLGLYDDANLEVFQLNRAAPVDGRIMLRRGKLGEIKYTGNSFVAEVRGLTQQLTVNVLEQATPFCRAKVGDTRCKLNMAPHTFVGVVDSIAENRIITDASLLQADDYFTYGVLTMTTGAAQNMKMEVKGYASGVFYLALPFLKPVAVGDAFSVVAGCDNTQANCVGKFGNIINFRGEPYVPGLDRAVQTAGTRR